jgi:hypothetical protein
MQTGNALPHFPSGNWEFFQIIVIAEKLLPLLNYIISVIIIIVERMGLNNFKWLSVILKLISSGLR